MIYSFGSVNMDLVCQTPRLPTVGETILGTTFQTMPGGKGANQAVAAARLGAAVTMVGRVGPDAFGQSLLDGLRQVGMATDEVLVDSLIHSGVASIVVDGAGNNHIVVVPGANGAVGQTEVTRLAERLQGGDFLLMQLEIPLAAVLAAARVAQGKDVRVILDPAPAQRDLPEALYPLVDVLTPNQGEASQLVGFPVQDIPTALAAAQALQQRGVSQVIVKLGDQGVVVATAATSFHQPAIAVHAVDTVAAGDAFNGGLAVGLSEGMALIEAVQFATAVAAYAVTQRGAQGAMPTRSQAQSLLEHISHPIALGR